MSTPISPTRVSVYKTLTIFPCAVADRWSQSWRGVICVIFLLSLGTIAACAPAQSSPGFIIPCCLSPGFGLCLFFISCFYFSCFSFSMLLLLFFRSLVRLASLSSLFSPWARVAVFSVWTVLRGGLAAPCLVSQRSVWSRGALLRRLGLRRCECDSKLF